MFIDNKDFYMAILTAGPILTGFCGTFLQFRIQREATYYRQVALSYDRGIERDREYAAGRRPSRPYDFVDIYIGLTHFTSSFALIILSTLFSLLFGLALPLMVIGELVSPPDRSLIVGGLFVALVFLIGYFAAELIHYRIVSSRLLNDSNEWHEEFVLFVAVTILALFSYLLARGWW